MELQHSDDEFDENGLRKRVGSLSHESLQDQGNDAIDKAAEMVQKVERVEQLDRIVNKITCGDHGSAEVNNVSIYSADVEIKTPELTGPVDEFIRAEPTNNLEMEFNDDRQQYEIEANFSFT